MTAQVSEGIAKQIAELSSEYPGLRAFNAMILSRVLDSFPWENEVRVVGMNEAPSALCYRRQSGEFSG
jgi:hypothetical protein